MNTQSTEQQEVLFERARAVDWCDQRVIVLRGSITLATESAWRHALSWATDSELELLAGHVKAAEVQQAARRGWEHDIDQRRAERERPQTDEEKAESDRFLREAAADQARANSQATSGQIDKLIAINERIAAALERK